MKFTKSLALLTILTVCLSGCSDTPDLLPVAEAAVAPTIGEDGLPRDKNGVIVPEAPKDINLKPGETAPPEEPSRKISSWAEADVKHMTEKGLIPNRLQQNYQDNITREEFAEIITKAAFYLSSDTIKLKSIKNENIFEDVKDMPHIDQAYALGVINGITDTRFSPNSSIARQEATTMMANFLKSIQKQGLSTEEFNFPDRASISSWAKDGVNISANAKIFQGSNLGFRAADKYTREQAIITVKRLIDFAEKFDGISIRGKVYIKISDINTATSGTSTVDATLSENSDLDIRSGVRYVKLGNPSKKVTLQECMERLQGTISTDAQTKIKSGEAKITDGDFTIETSLDDCLIKISWK